MSKSTPHQTLPASPDRSSGRESWLNRHRGKIALILGIGLGVNARSAVQAVETTLHITVGGVQHLLHQPGVPEQTPKRSSPTNIDNEDETPDNSQVKIKEMPSACQLREGTYFAEMPELDALCTSMPQEPLGCHCPTTGLELVWQERDEAMRDNAEDYVQCALENGADDDYDPTCDKGKSDELNLGEIMDVLNRAITDEGQPLGHIPEAYRELLIEFDPSSYRQLRKLVYVGKNAENDNTLGVTGGPYSLVCGKFMPAKNGPYFQVGILGGVPEIDIEKAILKGDQKGVKQFVHVTSTLAHEAFGHAKVYREYDHERCGPGEIIQSLKGELYAQYTGARMLDFLAQRWPVIHQILKEDAELAMAVREIAYQSDICGIVDMLEAKKESQDEIILGTHGMTYLSYREAEKTGDWSSFKRTVLRNYLGTQQPFASLPYILEYYRQNGREADFREINTALKEIMNGDSPAALFPDK